MPDLFAGRTILRRRKHLVLLLTLVGVLTVESSGHLLVFGPVATDLLLTLVVFAVFLVVFEDRRERAVAFVVATAAMAMNWSRYLTLPEQYEVARSVAHHGLIMVFLGYAVTVIL